ncbi:hypothetical protein RYZ51_25490, partial [Escherichia coli]|uniref:hypothetical protein n=1 Tax=Escherichia coli TaxID=562 RepID=UPI0029654C90
ERECEPQLGSGQQNNESAAVILYDLAGGRRARRFRTGAGKGLMSDEHYCLPYLNIPGEWITNISLRSLSLNALSGLIIKGEYLRGIICGFYTNPV